MCTYNETNEKKKQNTRVRASRLSIFNLISIHTYLVGEDLVPGN